LPEARAASSSRPTQKPPHHAPSCDQVHSPVSGSAVMGKRPADSASVRSMRRIKSSMTRTCPKMDAVEHGRFPVLAVGYQAPVIDGEQGRSRWRPSLLLRAYAGLVVLLRWPIVLGWLAAAAASVVYLPAVGQGGSDLEQLVSANNPAVASEARS